jgi:prepilin-type processing-associated H-X9-DG protein
MGDKEWIPGQFVVACRPQRARYHSRSMHAAASKNPGRAFTIVELLVLIGMLAGFLFLFLPVNPGRAKKTELMVCMNNLKQTGLGFVMWSDDNGGAWPWQVSTNQGGTMELIPNGRAVDHFLTLSNYLTDPRVLLCPTDNPRYATNSYPGFGNQNLSYFAGVDAFATSSNRSLSILSGDRHLQLDGQPAKTGLLVVSNHTALGWTKELHSGSSESPVGNLSFADGHVERVRALSLSSSFRRQALVTSRLVIP